MASADLRKELECSVCLDIYKDPVILKCGHNFCRDCIGRVWDTQEESGSYSCPKCREEFQDRSALRRNITLRNIVENFFSAQPDQESSGVCCTYCIHIPVPAVISCLMCEAFLCDNHLKIHSKSSKHVLCDLTTSLKNRKCPVHNKLLTSYCIEHSTCICESCEDHFWHKVKTLDEASEMKKKKLRNVLQKLMTERDEMEKRVQRLEEHRRKVQGQADDETKRVIALFRDLRRRLKDLEKRVLSDISGQAERIFELINDLETNEELSRKMLVIKKLCNTTDPLTVLQESDRGDLCDTEHEDKELDRGDLCDMEDGDNEESGTGDMCNTEDGDDEDRERRDKLLHDIGDLDVAGISYRLHICLSDIMQQISGVWGVTDILLDVGTAANNVHISDDMKTASASSSSQNRTHTPERFITFHVMSSQSFSSGRHCWDVDVRGTRYCFFGVCYPSMHRGYETRIGWNRESWGVRWGDNNYSMIHDSERIQLPHKVSSKRVRIYLDYEAGRIAFFELCDPIRHLHTYTATFTKPLHAVIGVWNGCVKISGGNAR